MSAEGRGKVDRNISDAWQARRYAWRPQKEDAREAGDVDYGRVIHSASFRRLQGKTQILNLGDSDFYRTRLTHSLEVAQIAVGIVSLLSKQHPDYAATGLLPDRSLIQAVACAHDLGHPPFGHGGEVALNYCMRVAGGFEGNGQTLRLLTRLEAFSPQDGANLSRRVLLGVLKYPAAYSTLRNPALFPRMLDEYPRLSAIDVAVSAPPKCHLDSEQDVVDWVLSPLSERDRREFVAWSPREGRHAYTLHKSLDCSIMDIADDIAYGVHDLEDAAALGLVSSEAFRAAVSREDARSYLQAMKEKYREEQGDPYEILVDGLFNAGRQRKRHISRLVHHFMTAVTLEEMPEFEEPLLRFRARLSDGQRYFLKSLKDFVMKTVIRSATVQQLEFKGQGMVVSVFEAFQSDPMRLLPIDQRQLYRASENGDRVICDYVAGMTDSHLLKTYERLYSPRMGSIFDRL